jgi:hypothetical protein
MLRINKSSTSKFLCGLLLACFCFTGGICDTTDPIDESPCGESKNWSSYWEHNAASKSGSWIFGIEAFKRIAIYTDTSYPKNICPDEHVSVSYDVWGYSANSIKDLEVRGEARWPLSGTFTPLKPDIEDTKICTAERPLD